MARYDLKSEIKEVNALNLVDISVAGTTVGNIIDMAGYNSLVFILAAGIVSTGNAIPLIEHGDEADLADAEEVSDDVLNGTEAEAIINTTNGVSRIGYVGKKRYVRLSAVSADSPVLSLIGIAIKSHTDVPTS